MFNQIASTGLCLRSPTLFALKCFRRNRSASCSSSVSLRMTMQMRGKSSYALTEQNFLEYTKPSSSNLKLNPVPDFNNARVTYASKTTKELFRGATSFGLCKIPILVDNAEVLLSTTRNVLGTRITDGILKATLYGHFCAGEDVETIRPVLGKLDQVGVGAILDYAAENESSPESDNLDDDDDDKMANLKHRQSAREYDYKSEAHCDQHVEVFKKCIKDAKDVSSKDSFAAIKVTALGNPKLLERVSRVIIEAKRLFQKFDVNQDGLVDRKEFERGYNHFFTDEDSKLKNLVEQLDPEDSGQIDYITWSMMLTPKDLPKITSSCREIGPLALATPTDEEIDLSEAMYERCNTLAKEAVRYGTRLLIDAEQVRYQPAIDNLVLDMQQIYNDTNRSSRPIIYNTYQCYLKDASERLRSDVERSDRLNYHFGAKLVRGAYMESERAIAKAMGYSSPIHDTIEDTHDCYNDSVNFLLRRSLQSDQNIEVMCATHNEKSIEEAIEAMNEFGVHRDDTTVSFAQLYGMADKLSFNLGALGYRVYKYVPYGEVHEVMPYLLRRAKENSAIVGGASADLSAIVHELRRRSNVLA